MEIESYMNLNSMNLWDSLKKKFASKTIERIKLFETLYNILTTYIYRFN